MKIDPLTKPLTLADLPVPPEGKTGWPWTEQSEPFPDRMPDGSAWPRISIVTPSYNQGQFIEATIRSVLLQNYPNLEYIIIDGGSTDQSIEIIQKYEPWLAHWRSESDRGQSDALNKGFARSTGAIMGWLNSDDLFTRGALQHLMDAYKPGTQWWTGGASQLFQDGTLIPFDPKKLTASRKELLHARALLHQTATFWHRDLWEQTGACISPLHYAMDYELWLRFSTHSLITPVYHNLGIYRTHDSAKTGQSDGMSKYFAECDTLRQEEYRRIGINSRLFRAILITLWTRYSLAKAYGWRSWLGRRQIPYV